jgi:hypothetical protein
LRTIKHICLWKAMVCRGASKAGGVV